MPNVRVLVGDVRDMLRTLPDSSVHCVVTSPPYWGLRSYLPDDHPDKPRELGLERTSDEYIDQMVEVFREVWRVLRPEGVLWLNLGDCFAQPGKGGPWDEDSRQKGTGRHLYGHQANRGRFAGLKPKDLAGIPWMVAFALRDDGWYLRSDVIWAKGVSGEACRHGWSGNPMPESVTDRPTRSHEYVFLLTKNPKYYYDADAIREPCEYGDHYRNTGNRQYHAPGQRPHHGLHVPRVKTSENPHLGGRLLAPEPGEPNAFHPLGRNRRSVWTISPKPFPGAHFATFPERLVEPMILAGSPSRACPACGAPWKRVLLRDAVPDHVKAEFEAARQRTASETGRTDGYTAHRPNHVRNVIGFEWRPTCACPGNDGSARGVVLDPFCGSGTTLAVAARLGRDVIGIELNPEYAAMARRRAEPFARQEQLRIDA